MAESKGSATTQQQARQEDRDRSSSGLQTRSERAREQGLERSGAFPDAFGAGPFQFMRRMSEEMDRVFDRVFDDFGFGRRPLARRSLFSGAPSFQENVWTPRIETFQKDDKFIVRAELPGLNKDDVEVNITEDVLTIQGHRQQEQEEQQEGFYHSERSYGSFYRAIPLPEDVIPDSAEASFRNGVLEIRLQAPPNEVRRGRKLEIKEESESSQRK